MSDSIGFVGLGNMGQPMALNLLKAGFDIRVWDIHEERMAPFVALGASQAFRLSDVAEPGGVVVSMVPDDNALLDIALSEGGIMSSLGPGGIHLSASTVDPETSELLYARYQECGRHFLTATVLGRPDVAAAAELFIFLSGDSAAKERVRSLLNALGELHDMGEHVEANISKLGANFLILSDILAMALVAILMERHGIDRAKFLDIIARSPLYRGSAVYRGYGRMIGERDYSEALFNVLMGLKDSSLILRLAEKADNLPLPTIQMAYEALLGAKQAGWVDKDWSSLAEHLNLKTGVLQLAGD